MVRTGKKTEFSLLIKPASADCNLRCDYCFYLCTRCLYPQIKTHRMGDNVLETVVSRYLSTKQNCHVFGWQGGEPTLMGVDFFRKVINLQIMHSSRGTNIMNALQTNATLVDDNFATLFSNYNFLVGVSIDGPEKMHNRNRRNMSGEGSHASVIRGIKCMQNRNVSLNALVMVTKTNAKAADLIIKYLCDLGISYHQFIPCVNYDVKDRPYPNSITADEWGDFLCTLFEVWMKKYRKHVSIRLFDAIIENMLHKKNSICHMQANCGQYFVVEHNGDVYPCDFFVKERYRLANIIDDDFDYILTNKKYLTFSTLKSKFNAQCNRCKYINFCMGDCMRHRLMIGNNSDKLSVLCKGWKKFFSYALPKLKQMSKQINNTHKDMNYG